MLANTKAIAQFAIEFEATHKIRPYHLTVSKKMFEAIDEIAFGAFDAIKKISYVTAAGESAELQIRKRTTKANRHLEDNVLTISGTVTATYELGV